MKLDQTDVKILEALRTDGRASFRMIAKRTGISTPTVSARVRALERLGVIQGYTARIDPVRLGGVVLVLVVRCKPADLASLARRFAAHRKVAEVLGVTGSRIFLKVVAERDEDLDALLASLVDVREVESYEHYQVRSQTKEENLLPTLDSARLRVACFYCGGPLPEAPVVLKLDRREHYLCCRTCARHYQERYRSVAAKARGG